ncbi:MAG: hypothetical protein MJZ94_05285 [Bacteroidales bacterium]|nr:hypothetical protein [Bacteroidales bacterium]
MGAAGMGRTAGKRLPCVETDGPALDSLVRFSSRRNEQVKIWMASFLAMTLRVCSLGTSCLDGFVVPPRHDSKRA